MHGPSTQVAVSTTPKSLNGRGSVRAKNKKGKASQQQQQQSQSPQQSLPSATMQLLPTDINDRSPKEVASVRHTVCVCYSYNVVFLCGCCLISALISVLVVDVGNSLLLDIPLLAFLTVLPACLFCFTGPFSFLYNVTYQNMQSIIRPVL